MIHVERHGSVVTIRMARALLGRPLCWTAAYWIDGLLIDTGPICTAEELARILEQLPVSQIAITHSHEDNIGGLAALSRQFPAISIYVSPRSKPAVLCPKELKLQFYRRLIWGTPEPFEDVLSYDDINNLVETPEFTFRIIETPGHSRGHISLFEPNMRWLFSGDAFNAGPELAWTQEAEMFGTISSLRTLAGLRPERLFPGSGNVRRTPLPELHQKIRQLIKLTQEVGKLESIGMTTSEIAACLIKEEPRITFWTRGHYSSLHLVNACRSYNSIFSIPDKPEVEYQSHRRSNWFRGSPQSSHL